MTMSYHVLPCLTSLPLLLCDLLPLNNLSLSFTSLSLFAFARISVQNALQFANHRSFLPVQSFARFLMSVLFMCSLSRPLPTDCVYLVYLYLYVRLYFYDYINFYIYVYTYVSTHVSPC
ncbi:hypothetical protein SPOG_05011, partial [Schizosaccharomyces cryophilus OY26]